jgi:hypothetical protein
MLHPGRHGLYAPCGRGILRRGGLTESSQTCLWQLVASRRRHRQLDASPTEESVNSD